MTTPLTPEGAKNWFNMVYSVTEKSTPITMFFLVAFMIIGYVVTKKEITRLHVVNQAIWHQLQEKNVEMLKLALECNK